MLDNFKLHTLHHRPAILADTGVILDGNIAITETLAPRIEAFHRSPFLAPMDLVAQTDDVLFINHAVQSEELPGRNLGGIDSLRDRQKVRVAVFDSVDNLEYFRHISAKARGVVNQHPVKGSRTLAHGLQHQLQILTACDGRADIARSAYVSVIVHPRLVANSSHRRT